MHNSNRHLLIMGCSATKMDWVSSIPAIERYDGPMYRVLRNFLRESFWPSSLSVAVLSAKFGLIGGLYPIEWYDRRMDNLRALELRENCTRTLLNWGQTHGKVSLLLGKTYLSAIDLIQLNSNGIIANVIDGPIGMKLNGLRRLLNNMNSQPKKPFPISNHNKMIYFLPDWDDMLDIEYDFKEDRFSASKKSDRNEKHCQVVMKPLRICDGILVSLAQNSAAKGILKKFTSTDVRALAPESIRERFGLSEDQWAFGDCGAFSYVNEEIPTFTTEQAVSLYHVYGFDFGASVDHIPMPIIYRNGEKVQLSTTEQEKRVKLTKENAAAFIELAKKRKCSFMPVGIIQGTTPESYARQLHEYVEMGYEYIGIGGLVPRSDSDILAVAEALEKTKAPIKRELWIHFFGVFRPKIHPKIREMGISSFDSATYFRKAWLRSDQNYLGVDEQWYAAIRVPMTSDPRTLKRLEESRLPFNELQRLEQRALKALHDYGSRKRSLKSTLQAVEEYDFLLSRGESHGSNLIKQYKRTLVSRTWEMCRCPVCSHIGIDVVIFRGYNRNKRRGAHNTFMLYNITKKGRN